MSPDIEDRRGQGGGFGFGGLGGRGLGLGGTLVLLVLSFVFRQNLFDVFSGTTAAPSGTRSYSEANRDAGEDREAQFVSFVLDDVQRTWDQLLPQTGTRYRHATLVLFRDYTQSACGTAPGGTPLVA
jgi:predicted metalloprotease